MISSLFKMNIFHKKDKMKFLKINLLLSVLVLLLGCKEDDLSFDASLALPDDIDISTSPKGLRNNN